MPFNHFVQDQGQIIFTVKNYYINLSSFTSLMGTKLFLFFLPRSQLIGQISHTIAPFYDVQLSESIFLHFFTALPVMTWTPQGLVNPRDNNNIMTSWIAENVGEMSSKNNRRKAAKAIDFPAAYFVSVLMIKYYIILSGLCHNRPVESDNGESTLYWKCGYHQGERK